MGRCSWTRYTHISTSHTPFVFPPTLLRDWPRSHILELMMDLWMAINTNNFQEFQEVCFHRVNCINRTNSWNQDFSWSQCLLPPRPPLRTFAADRSAAKGTVPPSNRRSASISHYSSEVLAPVGSNKLKSNQTHKLAVGYEREQGELEGRGSCQHSCCEARCWSEPLCITCGSIGAFIFLKLGLKITFPDSVHFSIHNIQIQFSVNTARTTSDTTGLHGCACLCVRLSVFPGLIKWNNRKCRYSKCAAPLWHSNLGLGVTQRLGSISQKASKKQEEEVT